MGLRLLWSPGPAARQFHWQLDLGELEQKVKAELLPALSDERFQDADVYAALAAVSRLLMDPVAEEPASWKPALDHRPDGLPELLAL